MSLIAERYSRRADVMVNPFKPASAEYQLLGQSLVPIADTAENYIRKGYDVNDIIYSIINLILDKVRVAPWGVYKVKDISSLKSYYGIISKKHISPDDFRKALDLRTKALAPITSAGKIGDLLKYPNDYDTWNDLVANGCGYKLLTGNKHIWGDLLDAGANRGLPNKLWLMPSQYVTILAQRGFPAKVIAYEIPLLGLNREHAFRPEEVLHEKYVNYNYSVEGNHLIGTAPMKAALKRLKRNNSAIDASSAKLENGGLEGIIYLDHPEISAADRKLGNQQMTELKQKLISEYTGPENAGKLATSGWKVGIAQMGYTPVELDIMQAEMGDLRFFANIFGVPSQLLNDPGNKTFNNQKEGEKALTTRCALPLLISFRDALNRQFTTHWGMDKSWLIDFDMSVYSELAQDMKETVEWLNTLMSKGMPLNRALELLNLEKLPQKEFNEPWITPAMGQPYSDWTLNEVDNALNNEPEPDDD